MEDNSSTTSI